MIIAVDFDGTCVTHEFPSIGKDIGAVPVLQRLVRNGHKLILFTMRSDVVNPEGSPSNHNDSGTYLSDAVKWFADNGIELWGIQNNPEQGRWTSSPKAYAQLYIDDAALGCPCIDIPGEKLFVNWSRVEQTLQADNFFDLEK